MRKIKCFLSAAVFIAAAVFLSPARVYAQGGVTYSFLEVVDFSRKPVADAKVETMGCYYEKASATNQNGQLEKDLPICIGDFQTYNFTVSKPGYFTFEDLGTLYGPLDELGASYYQPRGDGKNGFRIELLKIPRTDAERKAVGNEQLKRELFLAVKYGKTDEVVKLLKAGVSPNLNTNDLRGVPAPPNVPAIIYAAAFADVKIIKAFLDAGANIRKKDSPARNILLYYLRADADSLHCPFLGRCQTEEESANTMRFFEEGFDMLVKAGADINAADAKGNTVLTTAVFRGYTSILKKLLALNRSEKAKSEALKYLIYWQDSTEPHALEYADLLIKAGADPNFIIEDVYRPPLEGCASLLMLAAHSGKTDFIKLLLANKADINLKCKNGKTPIIAALEGKQPEAAKLLLDAGATGAGFGGDWRKRTALMIAAEKGYMEIAKMLLAKGFSLKDRDEWEETALEIAIGGKASDEMIELLLKAGADPNGEISPYCKIPLTYSDALDRPDVVRLLIAYKADVNLRCGSDVAPIVYAARNSEANAVKILLEAGADATGEQGRRALNHARENLQKDYPKIKANAEEIIKLLEAAGAK